jgi:hypothetical protein
MRHNNGNAVDYTDTIEDGADRSEGSIRDLVSAFTDLGFTELYLVPTAATLSQVDRLADLVL